MTDLQREKEIENRIEKMRTAKRSLIASIDTFEFDPKLLAQLLDEDLPHLLAELKEARETLEAVKVLEGKVSMIDASPADSLNAQLKLDALNIIHHILNGGERDG